ncbi:MAG: tetratricopeptide repeat protein, partial [Candidatus Omnitrophota bacterium]|nr:tetratricopeptide repeat protein [Candidatus Omnitrophota bacterium]
CPDKDLGHFPRNLMQNLGLKIIILFVFLLSADKAYSYVKGFEPVSLDRGLEHASDGRFFEAKEEFEEGLKKDREIHLLKEAIRIVNDFFDKKITKDTTMCIFRGIDRTRKGLVDEAILDFNQALKAYLNYAPIYNNRGFAYYRKRDFTKAKIDLTKAIELEPNYVNAYYNRGITLYLNHEYKKALLDMQEAKALGMVLDPAYLEVFKKAVE